MTSERPTRTGPRPRRMPSPSAAPARAPVLAPGRRGADRDPRRRRVIGSGWAPPGDGRPGGRPGGRRGLLALSVSLVTTDSNDRPELTGGRSRRQHRAGAGGAPARAGHVVRGAGAGRRREAAAAVSVGLPAGPVGRGRPRPRPSPCRWARRPTPGPPRRVACGARRRRRGPLWPWTCRSPWRSRRPAPGPASVPVVLPAAGARGAGRHAGRPAARRDLPASALTSPAVLPAAADSREPAPGDASPGDPGTTSPPPPESSKPGGGGVKKPPPAPAADCPP